MVCDGCSICVSLFRGLSVRRTTSFAKVANRAVVSRKQGFDNSQFTNSQIALADQVVAECTTAKRQARPGHT
eukprot:4245193-Pyramimonas_sp.AAC.2